MKKLPLILSIVFSIALISCNKQDDKTVTPSANNPSTPTPINLWTWTGTPPFSVKVAGVDFQPDLSTIDVIELQGYINIYCYNATGDEAVTITILNSVEEGREYLMPSPCNVSFTAYDLSSGAPKAVYSASTGRYKITKITATEVEGYYFADLYVTQGSGSGTKKLTEGYFKVNR